MSELQNTTYLNLIDCYRPKRRPIRQKFKKKTQDSDCSKCLYLYMSLFYYDGTESQYK